MEIARDKRLRLVIGVVLSAVGGGVSAWLTNAQIGRLLGDDLPTDLPAYVPPPEGGRTTELPDGVAQTGGDAAPVGDGTPNAGGEAPPMGDHAAASMVGDWHSIVFRNIFNSDAAGIDETTTTDASAASEEDTSGRMAPLCVFVQHTLQAEPAAYSWALVSRDAGGTDQDIFQIGDEVFEAGSKLIKVTLDDILILRADGTEVAFAVGEQCKGGATAAPPPTDGQASAGPDDGSGIQQTSDTSFVIPREEIDKALGNLEQLAKDARVVPHYQNGEVVGFKVFRIKAGSVFSRLGVKNGDILERVNGQDLNSPERALALYQTLKNEGSFQLDLKRRNQPMTLSYEIR